MMKLSALLTAALAIFLAHQALGQPTTSNATPPNIIVILADDMGFSVSGLRRQRN